MLQPTLILTPEQIEFFHRNGYLTLDAITSADEVIRLQETYDRIFAARAGRAEGDHLDLVTTDEDDQESVLPQILNPSKYAPELIDTQLRVNAAAIAQQLLGDAAAFHGDHAIRKPAASGVETPWHQDEAYWDADKEYNAISIWVPLQEATLENGCMQFVPGVPQQEVLPHHPIGHDPRVIGLEVDNPAQWSQQAVACPLPPGGATIHHSRTLHFTGANYSSRPRRAYIMAFGAPSKQRAIARDFYWLRMQKTKWHERAEAAQRKNDESGM
ncbi:MAG: phytanoyl-CoA dioxygenase family protein [Caldilineaceae bacterium]